jgi:hypothetical protein
MELPSAGRRLAGTGESKPVPDGFTKVSVIVVLAVIAAALMFAI